MGTAAGAVVNKPVAVCIEKVYEEGDFPDLAIGVRAVVTDGAQDMTSYKSLEQGGATVEFTEQDRALVPAVLSAVNAAAARLSGYFAAHDVPSIRTILVPSRAEFDRCVIEVLGVQIEVPSDPVRIAQPQRTDLVLLSPSAWDKQLNKFTTGRFWRLIAHEVAHIVEEHLSPNIECVPRWWSEGLAIYLSDQWKEAETKQDVLSAIRSRKVPSIRMMQDGIVRSYGVRLCYVWGWTLVMYVDCMLGKDMVRKIVRECDDGDLFRVIGQSQDSFEAGWKDWLSRLVTAELLRAEPEWGEQAM